MRVKLLCAGVGVVFSMVAVFAADQARVGTPPPSPSASSAPGGDCVTIAVPNPARIFTYQHRDPGGTTSTTNQWESVTPTGSRLKITGPAGTQIQINTHTVMGDVAILTLTKKTDGGGRLISSTSFNPGLVSDPAFRACKGKSWGIGSVMASYQSTSGQNASAMAPGGTLSILGIREKMTTPAGTFDTVHYVRATSQSNDEYWKSTEHGVVVKHVATSRGGGVTETLMSIK